MQFNQRFWRRMQNPPPVFYFDRSKRSSFFVHRIVLFYLRFLYSMFKTKKYLNNRKVAEAVSRILSNSVDPLFYLSSFQNPFAEIPGAWSQPPGIFPSPGGEGNTSLRCSGHPAPLGSPDSMAGKKMLVQPPGDGWQYEPGLQLSSSTIGRSRFDGAARNKEAIRGHSLTFPSCAV